MSRRRFVLLFAATAVFFGGTFVAAKAGLPYVPPLLFVSFRFDIASVLLVAFVLVRFPREEWLPQTKYDLMSIVAAGVLPIGLANGLLFVGQQYTTSAIGSIIFSLNPILTPVFAAMLLAEERLSRTGAIGMAVAFAGVGLVIGLDPMSLAESLGIGQLILLGGAASAALGSVLIRWADGEMSSTVRTAWGLPIGAALCHLLSFGSGERLSAVQWTPTALVAIGYVSVFSGMLAYIAYFNLLDDAGAIRANLAFYGVPVVAAIGGWAVLGESITALTVGGFLTVFAGFAIIGREQIKEALGEFAADHLAVPTLIDDRFDSETLGRADCSTWNDQD